MRLIWQLIKDIWRVLQKLLNSTFFVPAFPVSSVTLCLNLNEPLLLAIWKLAKVQASVKGGSSL